MATYTEQLLSGSTNGRPIKIAATATPGTLIHTEGSSSGKDKLYLYAVNTSAAAVKLTIEFGGTTSPDDLIEFTVPAEDGLHCIIPGLLLSGAVVVRGFAATGNVVTVVGGVVRIE